MKIPKEIINIIKQIEKLGSDLALYEKDLYDWLDEQNIDYDYIGDSDTSIDTDLNILFQNHCGNDLIKSLQKLKKGGN